MRIKFEIYSSLFSEVSKFSQSISKNMQDFGYEGLNFQCGWKIGEVTVTLPEGKTKQEVKQLLEREFQSKVTEPLWLKEVAYEENS
jgi:uncharacterized FlaG/YvyC family protein